MAPRYLVTGAAGFVGSHLVRHLLTNTDAYLVLPVTGKHRGNLDRLRVAVEDHSAKWHKRLHYMHHDLRAPFSPQEIFAIGDIDVIFNVASQSHVDRSITDPGPFILNNVELLINMLDLARVIKPAKFIQISTDEVYGPARFDHNHVEWETHLPSNPYSASKAAQEDIAFAYWRTYGVPVMITNTMNIIGETQDPEKFVPTIMRKIMNDEPVTVHTAPNGRPGSRFYLHARNQADALLFVAQHIAPDMYSAGFSWRPSPAAAATDRPTRLHVVGDVEIDNIALIFLVDAALRDAGEKHRVDVEPVSFHASRPGHDLRYALDGTKIAQLGWKAPVPFDESLERTVKWTLEHREWLR